MMNPFRTALLVLTLAAGFAAAEDTSQIEDAILQQIVKNTKVEVSPIQNVGVSTCFAVKFYGAKITKKQGRGSLGQRAIYAETADGMLEITEPGTDADMPELAKLVSPSFKLKTETDGLAMLSAIKALFKETFDDDVEPRVVRRA